jgi:hypothetical protein
MDKIEIHNGQAAPEEKAIRGKSSKQSLRFEKQTIRTLSGAELKLVGGGTVCLPFSCIISEVLRTK